MNIGYTKRQIELSKSIPKPQKIKGPAGTGKTTILPRRAVNAYERTKAQVLILTYNISIKNKIKKLINDIDASLIDTNKIYVDHYHAFMSLHKRYKMEYKYHAIFVDEVQDFEESWVKNIRNCLVLNGEIVFFADEKQNVYSREMEKEDKAPYTGVSGAWNKLKNTGFRSNEKIITLANKFQHEFLLGKYEYEEIGKKEKLSFIDLITRNLVKYYSCDEEYFDVNIMIDIFNNVRRQYNIQTQEICILCSNCEPLRRLYDRFIEEDKNIDIVRTFTSTEEYDSANCKSIERDLKNNFNVYDNHSMKMSTIQSFKGLESKTVFLIILRNDTEAGTNESIYTAITRACNNLIIINFGNKLYDEFFEQNVEDKEKYTFDVESIPIVESSGFKI